MYVGVDVPEVRKGEPDPIMTLSEGGEAERRWKSDLGTFTELYEGTGPGLDGT